MASSVAVPTCPVPVTPVPSTQEYVLTSQKHYLGNLLCSTFISGETAHDSLPFQVPRSKPEGQQLTWQLTACPSPGQRAPQFRTSCLQRSPHPIPTNIPPLPFPLPAVGPRWWGPRAGHSVQDEIVDPSQQHCCFQASSLSVLSTSPMEEEGPQKQQDGDTICDQPHH